jgi:hypothetical protein
LDLHAPTEYQVFQRRTKSQGEMTISGRVRPDCDRLEARLSGPSLMSGPLPDQWRELPRRHRTKTFSATLTFPSGGWYKLEVRALKEGRVVAQTTLDHVGLGEVFVGAGQSNSTNCGSERTKPTSGMVSTFGGRAWRLADDPQPGVHDDSTGGSFWPAFGDAMYRKYRVPIGVASTGHSGTSVNQWQVGGELFKWTTTRMRQFGPQGFRGVLWHQGESDVNMEADEYARKMTVTIQESQKAIGWKVPWFVARASFHNPREPAHHKVRAGQTKLWETRVAFEGPDTDTLVGDNRDEGGMGIHFSPKGLRAHGELWADKVSSYLDKVLAD